MFKFKLGRKQSDENETQTRTHRTTFKLQKFCDRGFPSRPSAIAYDSHLQLMAIGTQLGEIRMWVRLPSTSIASRRGWTSSYGQADFQISASLDRTSHIRQIIFLPGRTRLLVLTLDGYLHFFQINNGPRLRLHCLFSSTEDQQTIFAQIQTSSLLRDHRHWIVSLTNGTIYRFDLEAHTLEPLITTDQLATLSSSTGGSCRVPGEAVGSSVQSIVQHPTEHETLLVAFKNKLLLHWNLSSNTHERVHRTNEVSHTNLRVLLTLSPR